MTNEEPPLSQEPQTPEPADEESTKGSLYEGLTPQQVKGIMALLNEPTIVRAASSIDVNERTLRRWMDDPTFRRAYHAARREAFDHAIGLTQRYSPVAVNILIKIANDPKTPPAAKITAMTALLRFGRDGIELDDLAERLDTLERTAEQQNDRK